MGEKLQTEGKNNVFFSSKQLFITVILQKAYDLFLKVVSLS